MEHGNGFSSFHTENLLMETVSCGGMREQPICIYDFTVKTFAHDCLNFSTRHLSQADEVTSFVCPNYTELVAGEQPRWTTVPVSGEMPDNEEVKGD